MLEDIYFRSLKDLRISVTDRCNLRCRYCMPLKEYQWIEKNEILTFEEIARLSNIFVKLGIEKIRITGGEPLLRKELHKLVSQLSKIASLKEICLTTNGFMLADQIAQLSSAGLKRINVSLNSLNSETFRQMSQGGEVNQVLKGLFAAKKTGLRSIKINTVVIRNKNEREIVELVKFTRDNNFSIRFIEFMDAGNVNSWDLNKVVTKREIAETISHHFPLIPIERNGNQSPETLFKFSDGSGEIGIISSVTEPFCSTCIRGRITADGRFVTCLFSNTGYDLKNLIRSGAKDDEIENQIKQLWVNRKDRFSEERWESLNSSGGYNTHQHPKIEMITLGG